MHGSSSSADGKEMFCLFGRAEEWIRLWGPDDLFSSGQPVMSKDKVKLALSCGLVIVVLLTHWSKGFEGKVARLPRSGGSFGLYS